jgi:hypothetical protein
MDEFYFILERSRLYTRPILSKSSPNMPALICLRRVLYEKECFEQRGGGDTRAVADALEKLMSMPFYVEGVPHTLTTEELEPIKTMSADEALAFFYDKYPVRPLHDVLGLFDPAHIHDKIFSLQGKLGHVKGALGELVKALLSDTPAAHPLHPLHAAPGISLDPVLAQLFGLLTLAVYYDAKWNYVRTKTSIFRCSPDLSLESFPTDDPAQQIVNLQTLYLLLLKGDISL